MYVVGTSITLYIYIYIYIYICVCVCVCVYIYIYIYIYIYRKRLTRQKTRDGHLQVCLWFAAGRLCCIPLLLCNVRLSHSLHSVTYMRQSSQAVWLTYIKPEQIMNVLSTVPPAACCTSHEQGETNKLRSLVKTEYNRRRMRISNVYLSV